MSTMLPEAPRRVEVGRRLRWRQGVLLTVGLVLAVALLGIWMTGSGPGSMADPASASRQGSKALAQVLREQGVDVDVVRSIEDLESTRVDPTTTVVVSSFDYLGEAAALRLADHVSGARRLVLLEPGDFSLGDLGIPLQVTGVGRLQATAGCTTGVADPGDRIDAPGSLYRALGSDGSAESRTDAATPPAATTTRAADGSALPPGAAGCFVDKDGGAAVVVMPARDALPETVVLGSAASATNSLIAEASHAALSLRALGPSPHLVWYAPSVSDLDVQDPGGQQLRGSDRGVPDWFGPGVLLAGLAFLAFALARGRRLGRIVTEPLPVVVRAVETTEARGRLYRRASDRARAAASLRAGTRSRLAARLGVPKDASPQTLARAVAHSTGREPVEILALLDGPTPTTDSALVLLADQLADLEENVRRA